ncbi:MAG: ParB N-terminal domain-containing protein [Planctomycetota bacterium]|nr:ParB N-terminal domain-containing protein [Planctomycetota bacterium]
MAKSNNRGPAPRFSIKWRPTGEITPYENNPRLNDEAVEAVASSIDQFGWRQPIVVDRDGVVIAGHTRLKAARHLGLAKVPVHEADLTPAQAKAYRLADNRTGDLADWIPQALDAEMIALVATSDTLDLEALGLPIPAGPDAEPENAGDGQGGEPADGGADILRVTFSAAGWETMTRAFKAAAEAGPFGDTGNTNRQGNALARICEAYHAG